MEKDLRINFFTSLSRLKGVDYDSLIKQENSIETKAMIDKFIFQELPEDDRNILTRKAKSSRMSLPPSIGMMLSISSAQQQIISIISLMDASDNLEEFAALHQKVSSRKAKPLIEENQQEEEEPLSDFDKILIGIMSVKKSDLPKFNKNAKGE